MDYSRKKFVDAAAMRKERMRDMLSIIEKSSDGIAVAKLVALMGIRYGLRTQRVREYLKQYVDAGILKIEGLKVKVVS